MEGFTVHKIQGRIHQDGKIVLDPFHVVARPHRNWKSVDNVSSKKAGLGEGGDLLVPHEIDRPGLAEDIWVAADAVKSMLMDGVIVGDCDPWLDSVEALIAPILERDSEN